MVPRAHPDIQFTIVGPGEIVATDNGDATSFESFQSHHKHAYNGLALVIVKANKGKTGSIMVKASSDNLAGASATIAIK